MTAIYRQLWETWCFWSEGGLPAEDDSGSIVLRHLQL